MGKAKNKSLGTFMIAIYKTNFEFCYPNNRQHTHSYRSYENQLYHFMKLLCLRKSRSVTSLSVYIGNHITRISQNPPAMFAKVKEMERKYCLENPPGLAGKNNHLL